MKKTTGTPKNIRKIAAALIFSVLASLFFSNAAFAGLMPTCPFCGSDNLSEKGSYSLRFHCDDCGAEQDAVTYQWLTKDEMEKRTNPDYADTEDAILNGNYCPPKTFGDAMQVIAKKYGSIPNPDETDVKNEFKQKIKELTKDKTPAISNYLNSKVDSLVENAFVMSNCCKTLTDWFCGANNNFNKVRLQVPFANTAYKFILGLAICAVFVQFFMSLIEGLENNSITDERFFFLLAKLCLGIGFCSYGAVIAESIVGLGMSFTSTIQKSSSDSLPMVANTLSNMYQNALSQYIATPTAFVADSGASFMDDAASWLLGSFANGYFSEVFIEIGLFTIIAELIIRMLFSPIAIAELFFEGRRSSGFRALRGLCASAFTPVIIFMFIAILNVIRNMVGNTVDLTFIGTIALNFTTAASIPAARAVASGILG